MREQLAEKSHQLDEQQKLNSEVQSMNLKLTAQKSLAESDARLAAHYK